MNFTNINDPAGVKALLEQLRSSQAWQEVTTQSDTAPGTGVPAASTSNARPWPAVPDPTLSVHDSAVFGGTSATATATVAPSTTSASSVASLLSQLQASSSFTAITTPAQAPLPVISSYISPPPATSYHLPPEPVPTLSSARKHDLRSCTFQQALPHIARLSEDPSFIDAISTMKKEQADLERSLWEERRAIQRKHEEKVKVARTKANMIGGMGLTQHEADMMSDLFRRELKKFDSERVLPAWDGLVTKQQTTLESLGVPAMYVTVALADRERQQRIMTVLAGIVGSEGG
ncbi:hypothetical protein AcW2_006798 [Taiwanofungus camphoratus]|nr:hypothetical protein AcW2_006798 [Antrodia cinnamomea]